ncbi:MAG: UDP-glucose 6-dehydrogenase [Acidiphilium sp. 21-62-4]|nr:MAG: UDP-glucose 6-dehydrogenase [Acidocella sp. 20-57-95]OYV63367.1 MAG: UDP-glucose 6-dehydrogenase [Acidiphilium sp. 21-62-4]HQT63817.1 UDP-glucose/GDP-mannose dehydrogenase family protein [Acidocella sp.]HQU03888.1 UDP-glucose/GDP-mannose dehydrogenase family protein [Acidocella sp.]
MRITIVGGGYVGLVSGACFAALGAVVTIVEVDQGRFTALREGRMPIYEPGLEALVATGRTAGRLWFADTIEVVADTDMVFLAVGTPSRRGDGHADLTYVFEAAEQVATALTKPAVLVTKSTVPVGTGRRLAELMALWRPELAVSVASNPEFLREGCAIDDFMQPDRIVIGTGSLAAEAMLRALYAPLTSKGVRLLATGLETAEMIKYAANSFLAMKIAFINEMADMCEKLGAEIGDLATGLGLDQRIGPKFLQAGPGFGGSCFPKDTQAMVRIAQDAGAPSRLVETVVAVNEARKAAMASRIIAACGGGVRGKRIAVLGLTFKPNTDDVRDSPALGIIHRLVDEGAVVSAFDPMGCNQARFQLPSQVNFCEDPLVALQSADAMVVVTEWEDFKTLDPAKMRETMRGNVVVDLRNIFQGSTMRAAGFVYYGVGSAPSPLDVRAETETQQLYHAG